MSSHFVCQFRTKLLTYTDLTAEAQAEALVSQGVKVATSAIGCRRHPRPPFYRTLSCDRFGRFDRNPMVISQNQIRSCRQSMLLAFQLGHGTCFLMKGAPFRHTFELARFYFARKVAHPLEFASL